MEVNELLGPKGSAISDVILASVAEWQIAPGSAATHPIHKGIPLPRPRPVSWVAITLRIGIVTVSDKQCPQCSTRAGSLAMSSNNLLPSTIRSFPGCDRGSSENATPH